MKQITLLLALFGSFAAFAQNNPYEIFGQSSNVVYETKVSDLFSVTNNDTNSHIKALAFNIEEGYVLFLGEKDSILSKVKVAPDQLLRFLSVDPAANEYPGISPYAFVNNNPINAIDPDGRRILFVNGYYNTGSLSEYAGSVGGKGYWQGNFEGAAQKFFGGTNTNNQYIDGRMSWNSSATDRYNAGYEYAKANFKVLTAEMVEGETFKVVTHSQGGAYGAGLTQFLIEQGVKVEAVAHLSTFQSPDFKTPVGPTTYQLGIKGDPLDKIPSWTGFGGINTPIEGVDKFGVLTNNDPLNNAAPGLPHAATKDAAVFNSLTNLRNATYLGNSTINTTSQPGVDNTGVVIPGKPIYTNTGNSEFKTIIGQ